MCSCLSDSQVLPPAMGWCRNYHGYYWTDRRDGADTRCAPPRPARRLLFGAGCAQAKPLRCPRPPLTLPTAAAGVEGSLFGPERCGAIDMMHKDTHGYHYIDDTKVRRQKQPKGLTALVSRSAVRWRTH